MQRTIVTLTRFTKPLLQLLLLAGLLLPVILFAANANIAPHAQPELLAIASKNPHSTVSVIVQKTTRTDSAEQLVVSLGGTVTKDLPIINAFAAQLPASTVMPLAKAQAVRWVSLDAPMVRTGCATCFSTSNLVGKYVELIGATSLWNSARSLQGQGIGVAIVDSGINANHRDFDASYTDSTKRVIAQAKFNSFTDNIMDGYGHGTHVAGIIGGNGKSSNGAYIGVAPKVNLINVKVSDDRGAGTTSDVVTGLQWVFDNKDRFNIRVVNLSLNQGVAESYKTSPMDAALEILWFNGVVVTVSAGNNGTGNNGKLAKNGILYPPSNDPFVISVGSIDDKGTANTKDDGLAPFSASGYTDDRIVKPDLSAPGVNLIAPLAAKNAALVKGHTDHLVGNSNYPKYFRMSGTSMSSAVVAGAAALLIQSNPSLTPDQIKYRLKATAQHVPKAKGAGAGMLNIDAAVNATTLKRANTGIPASPLLATGSEPIVWNNLSWNSVNWNSVNWNSVNWNSVNWNSVNWNSVNWSQ